MEELWILLLVLTLSLGILLGIRLYVFKKAKKLVGRRFKGFSEGLVYFFSPRCKACKRMNPVIDRISREIRVLRVNILTEEGESLAKEYGILGVPTILVVRNGRIWNVIVGTKDYKEIKEALEG